MPASDSAAAEFEGAPRPAVHYVGGDTIVLSLAEGSIQTMEVVNQVRGWHFEPIQRGGSSRPAASSSTESPAPDSVEAAPRPAEPAEPDDQDLPPVPGAPEDGGPPRPEEEIR